MKNTINSMLSKVKLKSTKQRCEILQVMLENKFPQSYEQIKSKLSCTMDKATFYRNMTVFEEKKIVNKLESENKIWHYELAFHSHAHFICESCHKIACMDINLPIKINGYNATKVIFKGICDECENV